MSHPLILVIPSPCVPDLRCRVCVIATTPWIYMIIYGTIPSRKLMHKSLWMSEKCPEVDSMLQRYRYYVDDWRLLHMIFCIYYTHMHLVSLAKCDYIVMVQITFYSMTYSNNHLFLLPIGQLMENWAKLFRLSKWNNTDRRNTRTQILILRETRDTLPETNIAPENWWLQDEMSSWGGLREGNSLIS